MVPDPSAEARSRGVGSVALGVAGMTVALILGAGGLGLFLWSAFLGALITGDGQTFEGAAWLLYIGFALLVSAAAWLWKAAHEFAWPDGDPRVAFAFVVMVLWYGALAVLAAWVALRVTGVVGPLVTAHGL